MSKLTQMSMNLPKTDFGSMQIDRYRLEKRLGDGGFCEVYRAKDTATNSLVAIKRTDRSKPTYQKYTPVEVEKKIKRIMYREASIMKALSHPNLVKFFELIDDDVNICLVLELAEGGELFDFIIKRGKLTERDASHIIRQIVDAINYMHQEGFVHRDIKPENVLFRKLDDTLNIIIADFGLSRQIDENMLTSCGTMDYSAPELLKSKSTKVPYTSKIDNWSIGVVTYILLSGYPPFYSLNQDDQEIKRQIMTGTYSFHPPHWNVISKNAKSLISHFLKVNVNERISLIDALNHKWLASQANAKDIYPLMESSLKETLARQRWRCLGITANAIHNFSLASPSLVTRYGINK